MREALALLSDLRSEDVDWLLSHGTEREVRREDLVVSEGAVPTELFVVLEGLLEVRCAVHGDRPLNRLGPGELVGEISFLEEREASATVTVAEDGVLLALPVDALRARLAEEPVFAAGLYRALGRIAAGRLRRRDAEADTTPVDAAAGAAADTWSRLSEAVDGFKALMQEIEEAARKTDGQVPDALERTAEAGFTDFCALLSDVLGDRAPLPSATREQLGQRVQRELHPYVLMTRICERILVKPRGYAGDFLTIEWMYGNDPGGTGVLGPLIDRMFLELPAARAVRNRRGLLSEEIGAALADPDSAGRVTTLACGPAAELFDVYGTLESPEALAATLIDIDLQALALVSDRRDKSGLRKQMRLEQGNLVYLATGRQAIELEPQDLVYSIGLIDYFQDRFVVALLDWVHDHLRPGGRCILGNFHVDNPNKALMDHVFDWKLIHRTEEDMNRLFEQSKFGAPCTNIRYEEARVNLFAEGTKR